MLTRCIFVLSLLQYNEEKKHKTHKYKMTGLVHNMIEFVLCMTGFALNMTGSGQNMSEYVLNMTEIVLN